ncbi:MAG: hypothetical protein AAF745_16500, partial [Planctomycetota bacterium]
MADLLESRNQAVDESVFHAVLQNTGLLREVLDRLTEAQAPYRSSTGFLGLESRHNEDVVPGCGDEDLADASLDAIDAVDQNIRLLAENAALQTQVTQLQATLDHLPRESNESENPKREVSWDDRKKQILEDLENDSFDAEAFLTTLRTDPASSIQAPAANPCRYNQPREQIAAFIDSLQMENQRLSSLTEHYETELIQRGTNLNSAPNESVQSSSTPPAPTPSSDAVTQRLDEEQGLDKQQWLDKDTVIREERKKLE